MSPAASLKRKTVDLVTEVDQAELAVRIVEIFAGVNRPDGMTPIQALHVTDEVIADCGMRAALAAMKYITECINRGSQPS